MSAPLMPQKPRSGSAIADIINSRWLGQLWDCVNYAIRFPKGDDCTIVRKGDRMFFIGRRSSSGSAATAAAAAESSGYFSIADASAEEGDPPSTVYKVTVFDGRDGIDGSETVAGYVQCGIGSLGQVSFSKTTLTLESPNTVYWLYREIVFTDDVIDHYTGSFALYTSIQIPVDNKDQVLLARVVGSDGAVTVYPEKFNNIVCGRVV